MTLEPLSQSTDTAPDITAAPVPEPAPSEPPAEPATPPPDERPKPVFFVGDHVELASRLLQDLTEQYGRAPVFDLGGLWVYKECEGTWQRLGKEDLGRQVQAYSGKLVAGEKNPRPLKLKAPDIRGIIQTAYDAAHHTGFFDGAPDGIAYSNGFLKVAAEEMQLRAHSPKHRATMVMPTVLDPAATAPRFEQFLTDVFRDDDDRAEKIAVLQEFYGACLIGRATSYQTALAFDGEGSNGKSTFLDILSGIFPAAWIRSMPPHCWGHEYNRSLLPGARLNCVNELPESDLMASDMIKSIISGDEVQARVIREAPFTFRPVAGHVFAANRLPSVTDQSHGLWRRFIVIGFNRIFKGDEIIRDLSKKILREEAPGIVNWALAGAQRILKHGSYTVPASSDKAKESWRRQSDNVASFMEEMEVIAPDPYGSTDYAKLNWTPASTLYVLYQCYCRTNGFKPGSSRKFAERMKALGCSAQENNRCRWYPVKERLFVPRAGGSQ